jgi:cbb3-type cytochrome c oxidase subunit III
MCAFGGIVLAATRRQDDVVAGPHPAECLAPHGAILRKDDGMRSLRLVVAVLLTATSFALLASCQPRPDAGSAPALSHADSLRLQQDSTRIAEAAMRGGRAFLSHCAMCHGTGGNGDGDAAPVIKKEGVTVARLNDAELMDRLTRQQILEVITKGGGNTNRSNIMPAWGEKLDARTISDIADFVVLLRTANPAVPRSTLAAYLQSPAGVPADGRETFVHHCVACHGDGGRGDGPYGLRLIKEHNVHPRNLTDSAYVGSRNDKDLFAVITLGGGHFRRAVYMPAWTVTLTPAQVKNLVAYIREISHTPSKP